MTDFNERFKELNADFPYIRFLSAKVDADRFKLSVAAVYQKERERDYIRGKEKIVDTLKKMLPPSVHIELNASPVRHTSAEIVRECLDMLRKESVFVFSSLTKEDIAVTTGDKPSVILGLPAAVAEYAEQEKLDDRLADHLAARMFCRFNVAFLHKEEDLDKIRDVLNAVVYKPKYSYERPDEGRRISPAGRTPIYGDPITADASYICDCIQPDFAVIYGTMTDVRILEYTPKKPVSAGEKRKFVTFFLDDTTGKMRCVFFPGPKSQGVVKYFTDGATVIADGRLDYDTRLNDGSLQFRARRITGCERTEFSVNKVVRLVDDEYRYVKPEKYTLLTQSSLYGAKRKPLTDEPLVIFQVLTTSQNKYVPGEMMELGAVKLADGEIIETFSSLVRPHAKIAEEACHVVGLTLADLAGKPTFEQVIPDFYRFFDGYALTAFPFDFNMNILRPCLEKLHIPVPTLVEPTKYADARDIKYIRPKNTHRALPLAEAVAKFLINVV